MSTVIIRLVMPTRKRAAQSAKGIARSAKADAGASVLQSIGEQVIR
jgi:hypothetical protein